MIKILHSADWHLDSPLQGRTQTQAEALRRELLAIPGKMAAICRREHCDLVLLAGDLFDGMYTQQSVQALRTAMEEMAVPVFITPGNHDYTSMQSPWLAESWPENVHIFTRPVIESVDLPELNCRVYGAGFTGMDCASLLTDFRAAGENLVKIGIFHGDPTMVASPYNPITRQQVLQSGLDYLALGHIHKQGAFVSGDTLCAWPGCPMGRGYDEPGEKGVLLITIDDRAASQFIPLDTPRFYDLQADAENGAEAALEQLLPPVGCTDYYRITLTGPSEPVDIPALVERFNRFPNLELRDRTLPPVDVWGSAGEDTFEGMYFKLLQQSLEGADEETKRQIHLAARISRQILDGQEVKLP